MMNALPLAGHPLTDAEIDALLASLVDGDHVHVVVTEGPRHVGRAVVSVSGGLGREAEIINLVARSMPSNMTLHCLIGSATVTRKGVLDAHHESQPTKENNHD